MAAKRKHENKPQRLAQSSPKARRNARRELEGKGSAGPGSGRDSRRASANARRSSPLARLIQSLGQEKIRFQVVGMTAGILQGVLTNTLDTDIWVDLPTRQYMRLWNIIRAQGGTALSQTLYVLEDGKVVNFLFSVDGLRSFAAEFKNAITAKLEGIEVKLLPLKRILKSKKT